MMEKTCCFFGHRNINTTDKLKTKLYNTINDLIKKQSIDTFLFGSKSQFNDICYQIVCELKEIYPNIKRGYIRAEYPYINEDYEEFLLKKYEFTYYPEKVLNSGKASYIQRNYEMINKSKICIVYFDESYIPNIRKIKSKYLADSKPKSGTKIAYDYATKKQKVIINILEQL